MSTSEDPQVDAGGEAGQEPCRSPEARQFDFWLGDWEVSWDSDGRGTNIVEAVLDGCVILENFDGGPETGLRGMSVSTYRPQTGKWYQTWVDNQGNYLDFVGGMQGKKMILAREAREAEGPLHQRMVWYNVEANSLDWNWERSEDGGETWETLWHIHYLRRDS